MSLRGSFPTCLGAYNSMASFEKEKLVLRYSVASIYLPAQSVFCAGFVIFSVPAGSILHIAV